MPFNVDVVVLHVQVLVLVQLESYVQVESNAWQHGAALQQFSAAFAGCTHAITIIAENNPTIVFGKSKRGKNAKIWEVCL